MVSMKAIKSPQANFVFNPPQGANDWCDPVWVEKTNYRIGTDQFAPVVKLTYELEPSDLVHLNYGARIELTIFGDSMPPVSMGIVAAPKADQDGALLVSQPKGIAPPV